MIVHERSVLHVRCNPIHATSPLLPLHSPPPPPPPPPLPSPPQLKLETLKEFDWCLKKLETVDSAKSMGTMAQDKFRRILQRELSHMSESNKAGRHVAEWVNNVTESAGADNGW